MDTRSLANKYGLSERPINVGSIVKYDSGWYRVTRLTKSTVNLATIFGGKIIHKGIPKSEVKEDHDAWYESWSNSETYRCM